MKKQIVILSVFIGIAVIGCSGGSDNVEYKHHYNPDDWRTYQGSYEQQKDLDWLDEWEKEDPESFYGF